MLKISVVTIGDELLIGQVINTNSAKISEICTNLGASVVYQSSIGDNELDLVKELNYAFGFSDLVITSGGLGPTDDDITKPVIAKYFGDELVLSQTTYQHIKVMFEKRGRSITDVHLKQAEIPSKSEALYNKIGTAPGIFLDEMGKRLICLPGVPAEMRYLMENSVSDIIKKLILDLKKRLVKYKTIITSGIFESNLAELIGPATKYPSGISLAYLPSSKGVRLRIGASGINFDDAETTINNFESMILPKIKNYIIGYGKDDLITLIHQILVDNNLTISVAESCTSGMLGSELGSLPGSSSFLVGGIITYSNDVKNNILGVNKLTIAKHGAVSKETAIEMARLVRNKFGSSIGISITGIAGPDGGTDEKPVGTVFIGYADANESTATKFIFGNDRTQNRERAVTQSLLILKERILKNENISN